MSEHHAEFDRAATQIRGALAEIDAEAQELRDRLKVLADRESGIRSAVKSGKFWHMPQGVLSEDLLGLLAEVSVEDLLGDDDDD